MRFLMRKFLDDFGTNITPLVANNLLRLDQYFIMSRAEYPHRAHLLDKLHRRYPAKIMTTSGEVPHDKEWAFAHFIGRNGNIYFTNHCNPNKEAMEHSVANAIFLSISDSSTDIFDINHNAALITEHNVKYVVDTLIAAFLNTTSTILNNLVI